MFFQGRDSIKNQTELCQKEDIQVTKLTIYHLGIKGKNGTCTLPWSDSCAAQEGVVSRTTALGVAEGGKWVVDNVEED